MLSMIVTKLRDILAPAIGDVKDRVEDYVSTFLRDMTPEQVEAKLSALAVDDKVDLDWKHSIVDLLKLLDLPSSKEDRIELAADVGIADYSGTARQNIELHAEVLRDLAERDIKLPKRG